MRAKQHRERLIRLSAGTIALLLVGAAGGWSISELFSAPEAVNKTIPFTTTTLSTGTVSSEMSLNVSSAWQRSVTGTNQATGTVTSVELTDGTELSSGSKLYSVDLRPVVVAEGEIPSFRSLQEGSVGADVKQLQILLKSNDLYWGNTDGTFGGATAAAVKRWQSSLDVEQTGIVEPGDIVYTQHLPARLALAKETIYRGAQLVGGEESVFDLGGAPEFSITATKSQADAVQDGALVDIKAEGNNFAAAVGSRRSSDESAEQVLLSLVPTSGDTICMDLCSLIPIDGEHLLPATIILQPAVQGLVAPVSALVSQPNGQLTMISDSGMLIDVDVVASANGMAVIEGAESGTVVRVPASLEQATK